QQGSIEDAEALLIEIDGNGSTTIPLARLELIRNRPAVAQGLLLRRLGQVGENHLQAAPLIELLVEAFVLTGDHASADVWVRQLLALVEGAGREPLRARAELTAGMAAAAAGDSDAARAFVERALDRLTRLEMPL